MKQDYTTLGLYALVGTLVFFFLKSRDKNKSLLAKNDFQNALQPENIMSRVTDAKQVYNPIQFNLQQGNKTVVYTI